MKACVICSGKRTKLSTLHDDRYGYRGTFDLVICQYCGHKSLLADFSSEALIKLYTDYYPRSELKLDSYRPRSEVHGFRSWLNGEKRSAYSWVPENVRILDIGCGFGETLGYHKARGCEVFGVEADENIRRVSDKFGYNVHVGLFNPEIYQVESFDYVTMDQVIEHVADPIAILKGIARILRPGGILILSTPNSSGWGAKLFGRRWINWHAPYHLQHFSMQSMMIASEMTRFRIERALTITSSEWLHYQWIHALTFPDIGEPSSFWSPKINRGLRTRLLIGFMARLHSTKVNHIITRLFDALGLGDNHLFFLKKI